MGQNSSKSKDARPARARYWNKKTLEKRKIKRMVKAYGLTPKKAEERWYAERKGRVVGEIRDFTNGKANTHIK